MRRHFCTGMLSGVALLSMNLVLAPKLLPNGSGNEPRKPAPKFTLIDAKGAPITLPDYKGKVVLLNFWATWCHGCTQEMPWFIEFQDKFKDKGLAVIGVSMDDDGWKSVRPFIRQKKVNYAVVIGNKELGDQFGLGSMPMTVLIDRDGNIAGRYEGVVDREGCEKEIRALLEEKTTGVAQ
jgi:peroxiredoxin